LEVLAALAASSLGRYPVGRDRSDSSPPKSGRPGRPVKSQVLPVVEADRSVSGVLLAGQTNPFLALRWLDRTRLAEAQERPAGDGPPVVALEAFGALGQALRAGARERRVELGAFADFVIPRPEGSVQIGLSEAGRPSQGVESDVSERIGDIIYQPGTDVPERV